MEGAHETRGRKERQGVSERAARGRDMRQLSGARFPSLAEAASSTTFRTQNWTYTHTHTECPPPRLLTLFHKQSRRIRDSRYTILLTGLYITPAKSKPNYNKKKPHCHSMAFVAYTHRQTSALMTVALVARCQVWIHALQLQRIKVPLRDGIKWLDFSRLEKRIFFIHHCLWEKEKALQKRQASREDFSIFRSTHKIHALLRLFIPIFRIHSWTH